MKQPKVELTTF